jgi:hypothetical protein
MTVQTTDRPEFETNLAQLCAGFNVPLTAERIEAYWSGLQKMQISTFARVVEHCLGQDGPERIPTAPACWTVSKKIRSRPRPEQEDAEPRAFDSLHCFGQRCMMRYLQDHGPLDDQRLERTIHAKNRIVEDFRSMQSPDYPLTPKEVREALFTGFARAAS